MEEDSVPHNHGFAGEAGVLAPARFRVAWDRMP